MITWKFLSDYLEAFELLSGTFWVKSGTFWVSIWLFKRLPWTLSVIIWSFLSGYLELFEWTWIFFDCLPGTVIIWNFLCDYLGAFWVITWNFEWLHGALSDYLDAFGCLSVGFWLIAWKILSDCLKRSSDYLRAFKWLPGSSGTSLSVSRTFWVAETFWVIIWNFLGDYMINFLSDYLEHLECFTWNILGGYLERFEWSYLNFVRRLASLGQPSCLFD